MMRPTRRHLILPGALLLVLVMATFAAPPARAGDGAEPPAPAPARAETEADGTGASVDLRARLEVLREMSPEEREKLHEALRRFRSLPPEERQALRAKADDLGASRLKFLAGRDPHRLRRRHRALEGEIRRVFELIGEERLEGLGESERRHVRHEAMRRFQDHVRRRLMKLGGEEGRPGAGRESRGSRSRIMGRCVEKVCDSLLEELPEAERERLATLPAKERAAARAELFRRFRERETYNFVQSFDRFFLGRYLALPADERAAEAARTARRAHWHETASRLKEMGLSRRVIGLTWVLRADEMARLGRAVEETAGLDPAARRLEIEKVIRELHGQASTEEGRGEPGGRGRIFRRLNGHGHGAERSGGQERRRDDERGRKRGGHRRGAGGADREREPEEPR